MDTKLTLKLDKTVIENAKEYATSHKRSLSRIIESYLKALVNQDKKNERDEVEISPFVKSMRTGVSVPSDIDYREEYHKYISEKYK